MDKVSNRGNGAFLTGGGYTEQSACGYKQDIAQASSGERVKNIGAEHRGTAAAARAARVNVLTGPVKYHHAAVLVDFADNKPLLLQQLVQSLASNLTQIPCKNRVVIVRITSAVFKIPH